MLTSLSCIFPSDDIRKTAAFYEQKMGFRSVEYLQSTEPHICLYRDAIEIILTQTKDHSFVPHHILYGYGYDAYFYTRQQQALLEELTGKGVRIVKPLSVTDYINNEFVIEDIDGRWIGFGIKE